MKSILISGGAGFIGSKLSAVLVAADYRVTVLDNYSSQIHGHAKDYEQSPSSVCTIRGDVRSRQDWQRALAGQDVIVHFAAETGTGQSMYDIAHYVDVNVLGTATLLDILANETHAVKKMLVASSRAIYGEGKYRCSEHGEVYPSARAEADMQSGDFGVKCPVCRRQAALLPTDEDSKIHPSSVYGISKHTQEQLFMTVGRALGIPSVALRYQNIYGPGQSVMNPYTGILSIFSTRIRHNAPISIFEDGKEGRDFIYIDDAVAATRLAIENPAADYEVFNVGTGRRTDVLTVAQQLRTALRGASPIGVSGKFRVGDIRDNYADISKISAKLRFSPKIEFQEGIRRFAAWVRTQPIPQDRFETSIEELRLRGLYK